ncbi:MAG: hypothetical protein ACTFAL_15630 [Candidatus Electronema sp. V4]|uniref:hypothetical protein n=1 Tax=Candidatus Electronema sp. V4 TaxID=3454756 RepID=UPI0040556B33
MPEKTPTEQIAEILGVEFLPLLDPSEVRELQKALPGYQAVADDAARFALKHKDTLKLDKVRASIQQGLDDVARLEPVEHLLEKLYLSIYHQRLQATAKACTTLPAASATLPKPTRRLRRKASIFLIS